MNILVVLLLSAGAASAATQDGSMLSEQPPYMAVFYAQDERHQDYDQLTLGIRIPFLGGDITDEGVGEKWTDFFKSAGFGLSMRGAYLWSTSPAFAIGPYVGLSFDWFSGERQFFDDGVDSFSIEADTLFMMRSTVGVVLRENLGRRIMLEQYIGIGFALYSGTDATFDDGTFSTSVGFIESSMSFVFELGFKFAVVVSRRVDLGFSLAFELNGPPDVGSEIDDGSFDYEAQENFVLGFFININL
jgi:hypothetical protein